jgi:hypothetical protein
MGITGSSLISIAATLASSLAIAQSGGLEIRIVDGEKLPRLSKSIRVCVDPNVRVWALCQLGSPQPDDPFVQI